MKISLSRRVEAELVEHFQYGVSRFGRKVAERTFERVRRSIFELLAAYPKMGTYNAEKDIFEYAVPNTSFVVFYRLNAAIDHLTILAIFHHAQDRDSFED